MGAGTGLYNLILEEEKRKKNGMIINKTDIQLKQQDRRYIESSAIGSGWLINNKH